MLKRTIWNDLLSWKERKHHPLILSGLRQTGKTFIVKQFGKENYDSIVYLDLRANKSIHSAFDGDFNVNEMVLAITANTPKARFIPFKTLLILDEIQDCPNARSSLKYWDIDGRYDVIATGSFLGVKGFRSPYNRGMPVGYEEELEMHPLSFYEFLINTGLDSNIIDYVRKSVINNERIDETVHQTLRKLYYQFLIVGGMPEVCNSFFETYDLNKVKIIQKRILTSIKADFGRYKDNDKNDRVNEIIKLRAEAALDSLVPQLSKEYKKFQFSLVNVKGNSLDKKDGLDYLVNVGLVIKTYNTKEISYPLDRVKIENEFKVFMADSGLLVSMLGDDIPSKILNGDLSAYKGAICENMVAVSFNNYDKKLFYYHAPSGSPELDFVFEEDGQVTILECKSNRGRATSMKFVLANKKRFGEHKAIKLQDSNVGKGDGFVTYPLYAIALMEKKEESFIVPIPDVKCLKVPE